MMLTKITGPTVTIALGGPGAASTFGFAATVVGTYLERQNQVLPVTAIRIATGTSPVYISFTNTAALSNNNIYIPLNTVEYFSVPSSTSSVSICSVIGSGGIVSVTPIAS